MIKQVFWPGSKYIYPLNLTTFNKLLLKYMFKGLELWSNMHKALDSIPRIKKTNQPNKNRMWKDDSFSNVLAAQA